MLSTMFTIFFAILGNLSVYCSLIKLGMKPNFNKHVLRNRFLLVNVYVSFPNLRASSDYYVLAKNNFYASKSITILRTMYE